MTRRLDLALIERHPELSRRKARDVIEKGQVTVDDRLVRQPGLPVEPGSRLRWDPNRKALPKTRATLGVLYEDDFLLVVDKPPGLLTVPTSRAGRGEDTALARVEAYVRRQHSRRDYVGRVHRLDRDTSGAVLFARSPAARARLLPAFRAHGIERRYWVLVQGVPEQRRGTIELPLHDGYEAGRRRLARPGEPSHLALTRFEVLERLRRAGLLEVRLETGLQHQVRLHLAAIDLPVLGDRVYRKAGTPRPGVPVHRQMLHARILAFSHPITGKAVRVESPLPEDFQRVLAALRKGGRDRRRY